MTTKALHEYTDTEIEARLAFANRIRESLAKAGKPAELAEHLALEEQTLLMEKSFRQGKADAKDDDLAVEERREFIREEIA